MYDAIVIGSGPAGVFAAYQLRPLNVLLLDIGIKAPERSLPEKNIYDLVEDGYDLFGDLIGQNYQGVQNLDGTYISPKLKGPHMRYVWNRPDSFPIDSENSFEATLSFAEGGLANAWGAGVMRYTDRDLAQFPFQADELSPFYDSLSEHIGITGEDDDLTPFFGTTKNLLPPRTLSPIAESFKTKYKNRRSSILKKNMFMGRQRSAVLSRMHNNRRGYQANMQDFFQTRDPAVFTPAYTLQQLIKDKEINYQDQFMVQRFEEINGYVRVYGKNLLNSKEETFSARKLFIGAGCINTARIVLASYQDFTTKLPLLDNPIAFVPFVDPTLIGGSFPRSAYPGAELAVIHDPDPLHKEPIQASIYGLYGTLRSDLVSELPFSIKRNITLVKHLGPTLGMLQVFFPDSHSPENYLSLKENYSLSISHEINKRSTCDFETQLGSFIKLLHHMRYITARSLCKFPIAGSSIHYAGTLPMRETPSGNYETNRNGLLNNTKNTYIIDGANFPYLPSKNHTFTIMANSMRIAELAKSELI
jgi:choline dehydrogenase-like flavoprotein